MKPITFALCASAGLWIVLGLAGCKPGKVSFSGNVNFNSSSSSSDTTVNGYRRSSRTKNGVTRKLETAAQIDIQNGKVTKFPKGAVIKLHESGGPKARVAELRENGDALELWIEEDGKFRRGTEEDDSWLQEFLNDFNAQ